MQKIFINQICQIPFVEPGDTRRQIASIERWKCWWHFLMRSLSVKSGRKASGKFKRG
ncbi:MAG: hypothetical protein ACLR2O_04560 [Coprococcus sp.]